MTIYSTRIHGPSATALVTTNEVAHCQVCGMQWQVKDSKRGDAKGCPFCDAPEDAISIRSEKPTYGGATVRQ